MKTPETLLEATRLFNTKQAAHDYLTGIRWPSGVIPCPLCGSTEHWFLANQLRWKCKMCQKQFSVKTGTIFEDSPLGLDKWMIAAWLLVNCKNGISSYEIHRDLGVTQKTAWFMLQRLRLALQEGTFEKLGGKDGLPVEIDETFIGGKARNMSKQRKEARGITTAPMSGKETVLGFLERGGKVRTFHVEGTRKGHLIPRVHQNVKVDSTIYSDANLTYTMLANHYRHEFVDHAVSYVEGLVHTNSLENFWTLLKRAIKGTYVSVEPFHLFRYLDEQTFRFNQRKFTDGQRFHLAVSQVSGKRLTYRELTGKESAAGSYATA